MSGWRSLARADLLDFGGYDAAEPEHGYVRLHANEAHWQPAGGDDGLNRYPVPQPAELVRRMGACYGVADEAVLATRGSDDAIDVLVRAFCRAGQDSVLVCPPTFGMYEVAARIQGAGIVRVPLERDLGFTLDFDGVLAAWRPPVRLVFVCSPNNPTGNLVVSRRELEALCRELAGKAMVVVDEAYLEFAGAASAASMLADHGNLVVLRTLSKAFALAGARCGALLARPDLVAHLRGLLPPYPLPAPSVARAVAQLDMEALRALDEHVARCRAERERFARRLTESAGVRRVWPSRANFLLVETHGDSQRLIAACRAAGVLIRDVGRQEGLANCVRITVGAPEETDRVIECLRAAEMAGA